MGRFGNVLFQLVHIYGLYLKVINSEKFKGEEVYIILYTNYMDKNSRFIFEKYFAPQLLLSGVFKVDTSPPHPANFPLNFMNEQPHRALMFDDYFDRIENNKVNLLRGYFQSYKYIERSETRNNNIFQHQIINTLFTPFNKNQVTLFCNIDNIQNLDEMYFIHVRGEDYVNNHFHQLQNLELYYQKCIDEIKKKESEQSLAEVRFLILTNDVNYLKTFKFINSINYIIADKKYNEMECLYIMSKCKGGIAVNSSFSWWGSYLNANHSNIYFPYRWFPHDQIQYSDIYFKDANIIVF